jgi:hypothetical protein
MRQVVYLPRTGTTMSAPRLPPEISDYIVDLLRNESETLRNCCLVSKSWVPRARKRLFDKFELISPAHLQTWKRSFPDPANSPAYFTRSLVAGSTPVIIAAAADEGGWIRAFRSVVRLQICGGKSPDSLPQLLTGSYRGMHLLRLDHTIFSSSQVVKLICSLPLLEDLEITSSGIGSDGGDCSDFRPSTSPPLIGTLALSLPPGMGRAMRQLLNLPNGLRFRGLDFKWYSEEDLRWMSAIVEACSDPLERLEIDHPRAFLLLLLGD